MALQQIKTLMKTAGRQEEDVMSMLIRESMNVKS